MTDIMKSRVTNIYNYLVHTYFRPTSFTSLLVSLPVIEALGLPGQNKGVDNAQRENQHEEHEDADVVVAGLDVVVVQHALAVAVGRRRGVAGGAVQPELRQQHQVHRVLERAQPLRPAEEDGDGGGADEEAGEEDLRDEQQRGQLGHCFYIGAEDDEQQVDELALQVDGPVQDEQDQQDQQEVQRRLQQQLAEEVGNHAI